MRAHKQPVYIEFDALFGRCESAAGAATSVCVGVHIIQFKTVSRARNSSKYLVTACVIYLAPQSVVKQIIIGACNITAVLLVTSLLCFVLLITFISEW